MQSLDTLRGVAIAMVIAFHVSVLFQPGAWLGKLMVQGNQGVQLFFLVSAITMGFMWDQRHLEPRRQLKFYIRRFLRIAPLFWIAMCFYGLSWRADGGHGTMESADWTQIALTASFLNGFSPSAINKIVPGGWSIAVEMSFYLVFPWLAMGLKTPVQTLAFAFASYLLLGVVATGLIDRFAPLDPQFMYYSMLTQFPIFPVGMFVYRVALRGDAWGAHQFAAIVVAWLVIAAIGKYGFGLNTRPLFWVQIALFAALICWVIRREHHLAGLSYIGNLSYSMYLFHFAVLHACASLFTNERHEGALTYLVALAAVFALTTAVAKLSALTFEKWSAQLTRKLVVRVPAPIARLS